MQVMGRVYDYVRLLKLKKLGNDRMNNLLMPQDDSASRSQRAEAEQQAKQARIDAIVSKLKAGWRLSASDMEYLRQHAPAIYEKAVKILKERDEYQQKLRHCKTKEQARQAHYEKMQQLQSEAKAAKGNAGEIETIGMRVAAIQNEYGAFLAKGGLARIPQESELKDNERIRKREQADRTRERRREERLFHEPADEKKEENASRPIDPPPIEEPRAGEGVENPEQGLPFKAGVKPRQPDPGLKPDAQFTRRKKAVSAYKKAFEQ